MGQSGEKTGLLRRHRRKWVALCVLFGLIAAGWAFAERYLLDMERYRRLAEETIRDRTGIDARIGRLDVDLLPSPRVFAYDILLDAPEAGAKATRISAHLDLLRLVRREIGVSRIEIDDLDLGIAADTGQLTALRDRVQAKIDETKIGGDSAIEVALDSIRAERVRIHFAESESDIAVADIEVNDVLSNRIGIVIDGDVPVVGDDATLEGDVVVILDPLSKEWQLSGAVNLADADPAFLPYDNAPAGTVDAGVQFTPATGGPAMTLRASIKTPRTPALTGALEADAAWTGDALKISRLLWDAAGARIDVSGQVESAKQWSGSVKQARITEAALDALLAMAERPRVRFEADTGGYIDLKNLELTPGKDGSVRLASGTLDFTGLAVVPIGDAADMRAAHGIRGSLTVADNVISVSELRSDAISVKGTVSPDFAQRSVGLDLQANADLARLPWDAFDALASIRRLEGEADFTRIAGTFSFDGGTPADLALQGELRNGAVVYADESVNIDLRAMNGHFTPDNSTILTALQALNPDGAPITVHGAYDIRGRAWAGSVEADAAAVVPSIFVDAALADNVRPVAEAIGAAIFDVRVLPAAGDDGIRIEVERRGDLELNASTVLASGGDLQTIAVTGTLPVDTMMPEYFPRLTGTGAAGFALSYQAAEKRLQATLDATNCSVDSESVLRKLAGSGLLARFDARIDQKFSIESASLEVEGVPAVFTTAPPNAGVIPLEVQMSALAPLLDEGARTGGVIEVRYDTNASAAELNFDNVSLAVNDLLALDRVNGPLLIFKDSIATDGLELHGARSDCTLRVARAGQRWSGGLEGRAFNVHAVTELVEAALALAPGEDEVIDPETPANSFWDHPFLGEFAVNIGTVYYNRGNLKDVKFRIIGEERALRVREIEAQPYAGTFTASLAVVPDPSVDAILKLAMTATDLDAKTINDLAWPDDKGFFGTLTGNLSFDAPLDDLRHMLARGNGSVTWAGTKGSLGGIGFATKLLTALKTTDILNLRLRSLKDKGITYDTWNMDLRLVNGAMDIKTFDLDGGAYNISGQGTVDFAKDQTNALVYVRPLESVGKVIKVVPILGDLAAAVSTDLLGVPVKFTGSPYDLQASVTKELAKDLLTTPLRAGKGAVKSVGESVKSVTGGSGEGASASKTPDADAPPAPESAPQ